MTHWLCSTSVLPKPVTTTLSSAAFMLTGPSPCNILSFGIFKGSIGGKSISGSPETNHRIHIALRTLIKTDIVIVSCEYDEEIALSLSVRHVPL